MTVPETTPQALNQAMLEAVEFVHAEGWDAAPTLFALVPTRLLADQLSDPDEAAPLTLVVQDLPEHILPGSEELGDYMSRLAWPEEIAGVVLAQEIMFRDAALGDAPARPARLFSGVLRAEDVELTLLQLRPTEEELAEAGPFAEDKIELRGGPEVAPGVLQALRYGLEQDPEHLD
ncbi:PPA1309 family protein [Corynebacterium sp. YIM 101645]|uniref:PPA1309 family protein n=1 Tax=Corynebacterium lemuris TaxID=1859292 RepID=A0ABT2FXD1_9CORY|nr:PPA1309 family protein [Corynebacterium lemuris]MCS5478687.1 PPA1309 family protein [Corynebacterium lemuris]